MKRRDFLKLAGAGAAGAALSGCAGLIPRKATSGSGIRAITYNIRSFEGWTDPQARGNAKQPGPMETISRMAKALAVLGPDVICLQEVQRKQWAAALAERLGMTCAYFPGGWRNKGWPEGISGAVLSRFQILSANHCPIRSWPRRPKELFTRFWGKVTLATDQGRLTVHAAHLYHASAKIRLREIDEMLKVMADDRGAGRPVLLMGDLNHKPEAEEYRRWVAAGLEDAFALKGTGPELTCPSIRPKARIDYVWLTRALAARLTECRVLHEAPFGPDPHDASGLALSDHLPVLAAFA